MKLFGILLGFLFFHFLPNAHGQAGQVNLGLEPASFQSPFQLYWRKELAITGFGALTLGIGYRLEDEKTLFTTDELLTLNPNDINALDRIATDFSSLKAHKTSNFFFYGSPALPALLMLGDESRHDAGKISLLWFETMLVNGGVTHLFKQSFQRPRPFVFDENAAPELKMTFNAKASFISGHTSFAAANSFFAATAFSDYYPDSKLKPLVWTVAATVPAITGYLRVRAGRHYLTDVAAGYAVGALIGWGIPRLHRSKVLEENGLRVDGGLSGVRVRWVF